MVTDKRGICVTGGDAQAMSHWGIHAKRDDCEGWTSLFESGTVVPAHGKVAEQPADAVIAQKLAQVINAMEETVLSARSHKASKISVSYAKNWRAHLVAIHALVAAIAAQDSLRERVLAECDALDRIATLEGGWPASYARGVVAATARIRQAANGETR